jgi:HEAT repeat protein
MIRTFTSFAGLSALAIAASPASFGQKAGSTQTADESKLIAVLKSDASQKAKADACRELARVGTRDAVAPLAALLGDEKLSHMARYGLEPIPDPAVDAAFREALGKLKGRLLVGVIGSVGVRRDHHAVGLLTDMLQDQDADVAQTAARALGRIGTLDAARAIEAVIPKVPEANRLACYEGLFRCADVLRAQGQRTEARAIFEQLNTPQAPTHVRAGAARAVEAIAPR